MKCNFINNLKVVFRYPKLFCQPCKVIKLLKMPFYAVAKGRTPGIFMTWGDCEAQVKGFSGARYKKFDSIESAQEFVTAEGGHHKPISQAAKVKKTSASFKNIKTLEKVSHSKTKPAVKRKSKNKSTADSSEEESDPDISLDLMLSKQLDDVEKRLNSFKKGIDKLEKNATKSQKETVLLEPPQPKRKRKDSKVEFQVDNNGYVQVYTDGACSSNGKNGARAGLGVFWGEGHELNTSEPVSGRATNNCGEIQAATCAIKLALANGVSKLAINTDSKFLINSVTKWMPGWKKKGWKLQSGEPVKNEVDFKELDSIQNKLDIKWNYVEAHKGILGNEMADLLAKAGASKYNI